MRNLSSDDSRSLAEIRALSAIREQRRVAALREQYEAHPFARILSRLMRAWRCVRDAGGRHTVRKPMQTRSRPDVYNFTPEQLEIIERGRQRDAALEKQRLARVGDSTAELLNSVYLRDDYPREGCMVEITVDRSHCSFLFRRPCGKVIGSTGVRTPAAAGWMLQEWLEGRIGNRLTADQLFPPEPDSQS